MKQIKMKTKKFKIKIHKKNKQPLTAILKQKVILQLLQILLPTPNQNIFQQTSCQYKPNNYQLKKWCKVAIANRKGNLIILKLAMPIISSTRPSILSAR